MQGSELLGVLDKLRAKLQESYKDCAPVPIPSGSFARLQPVIEERLTAAGISGATVVARSSGNQVVVRALRQQLAAAHRVLVEVVSRALEAENDPCFPKEWELPMRGNGCQLFDVPQGSSEWQFVTREMASDGVFNKRITRIQRVQSPTIWERFRREQVQLQRRVGGDGNVLWMKHGTSSTPPSDIYDSDGGFDFRYANAGLFGRGAYFAFNASYSASYRYRVPDSSPPQAQMFLARVLCGKVEPRQSDRNIKVPSRGFDSIRGTVATGHEAIITYDLARAYPDYLVTYLE